MVNGKRPVYAPRLSSDPALYADRSPLNEVFKPILAQDFREPLRVENGIDPNPLLSVTGNLDTWNELENTDRIGTHPQSQAALLDVDLVSIGIEKADINADHGLLIPQ